MCLRSYFNLNLLNNYSKKKKKNTNPLHKLAISTTIVIATYYRKIYE